jgi:phosphatidylinositol glycan class T
LETQFTHPVEKQAPLAPLTVDQVMTTVDQTRGVLHVSVRNNDNTQDGREHMVVYAETLPWLVELYMHTLEVRVDGVRDGECDFSASFCFV